MSLTSPNFHMPAEHKAVKLMNHRQALLLNAAQDELQLCLSRGQDPHNAPSICHVCRRPKKKGADRRHKPAEYAPLPPPPPEFTVVSKV